MKKKIEIEGMSCNHCVNHVKSALLEIEGVVSADVSLSDKNALIEANIEISNEKIENAISDAGYDVVKIEEEHNEKI